ncbi:hypothetical protein [Klebsiella variicola]|uniref:hypothetical protein n=1 Tax=Klebsiella variicola TaxID=244366 RepID=UPI0010F94EA5|nr:hypothetical protein [Klebsiella variicola]
MPDKAPVGLSDTFDVFARQIHQACLYASMSDSLLALQNRLADTGRWSSVISSTLNAVTAMPTPRLPGLNEPRIR